MFTCPILFGFDSEFVVATEAGATSNTFYTIFIVEVIRWFL